MPDHNVQHAITALRLLWLSVRYRGKPWRLNYENAEAIYRWLSNNEPLPNFMDGTTLEHYMVEELKDPLAVRTLNTVIRERCLHGDPAWLIDMLPDDYFSALHQTIFPNGEMSEKKARKSGILASMEELEHLGLVVSFHPLPKLETHYWTQEVSIFEPARRRKERQDAAATTQV